MCCFTVISYLRVHIQSDSRRNANIVRALLQDDRIVPLPLISTSTCIIIILYNRIIIILLSTPCHEPKIAIMLRYYLHRHYVLVSPACKLCSIA